MLAVLATLSLSALSLSAPSQAAPSPSGPSPSGPSTRPVVNSATAYVAPVLPLRVVRAYDPPATRYGTGHRGVDLVLGAGGVVRAAGAGTVTFAGAVAGRGVVVIAHSDGIRTEYEPVTPSVRSGDVVLTNTVIGRLSGVHVGCVTSCLHWGARRGAEYLDPLSLLAPLGPVRLLPWS